jgi:hypothetical protein
VIKVDGGRKSRRWRGSHRVTVEIAASLTPSLFDLSLLVLTMSGDQESLKNTVK